MNTNVPKIIKKINDEGDFYLPPFTQNLCNRLEINTPVLISGPTGCGKTDLVKHLAEYFCSGLYEIDFSVGITESNIVGRILVENGETKFYYGLLPLAMMSGGWLLLDEIDFAEPEHLAAMQSVLSGGNLVLTQNQSEIITPHPNFRIFATANTKGRGDETQSYAGTNVLNLAFIDRFSIFEMDYTKKEKDILSEFITDDKTVDLIYSLFINLRKAIQNEEIVNAAFSTRRMIQVAKLLRLGETMQDVVSHEIINRFEHSEKPLVQEFVYDVLDRDGYLKGWKLGDTHPIIEESKEQI